ncbi:MAG: phosphatase PAP2 family protein [Pseudomonadota bacterium]|jgi:undecaprenyl-diphosphatase|nr:phosphatase PAP2 family protein [Pseudomonadota bacterium]
MLLFFILLVLILLMLMLLVSFDPHNVFDQHLITWVQQFDTDFLERGAIFLAHVGSLYGTAIIAFIFLAYSLVQHKTRQALILVLGFASTVAVTWTLKWLFGRPRPFIEARPFIEEGILVETYGSAFPSAHSAYAAMLAIILVIVLSSKQGLKYWVFAIAVIWAVLMGWSRVYLSAHYPTDVLAGWIVAVLMMILSTQLISKFWMKQYD